MIFAPHILQVKRVTPVERDEFGRAIPGSGGEAWENVCACRCDDNTTKEFKSENGLVYRPAYHIVCEGSHGLTAGDEVRCMDGSFVRESGKIYIQKSTNYFNYSEIWI